MAHAAGHQQRTLIPVGPPVAAAHSGPPGNVRAVRRAHTLGPSRLHFANLPGTAAHSLAGLYESTARGCNVTVLTSLQDKTPFPPWAIFTIITSPCDRLHADWG